MIILCGLHDIDEPILADIMLCLQLVLTETLNGCRHESSLTDVENYAKLTILVDEIVSQVLLRLIHNLQLMYCSTIAGALTAI